MTNANMQFDNRTLEPTFKLIMGEAGSSFTFEVAQKNGIPYSLINKAKKKRMIQLGNKVNDAAEKYFHDKKKRPLISEMLRIVETENSKRRKSSAKEAKAKKVLKKQTANELEQKIVKVRKEKAVQKKKAVQAEKNKPRPVFKVGDRVRMPY